MPHPEKSHGCPPGLAKQARPACGVPADEARRSGFVLIIVLILLLLMAIMAITWLGTVRYRVQMIDNGRGGNIQMVVSSVVNDIRSSLTADYPSLDKARQPAPYDYPWTNTALTNLPFTCMRPAPGQARSGLTVGDPPHDDPWLASSLTEGGMWPHLSNLRGSFLDVKDADLTKVPLDYTRQYIPTDKPSNGLEALVAANGAQLVDTDGDGIGDALWFFPAVSALGDRRYVAAVYIEDLSAKLNVNTAIPLRSGGTYATDSPGGNMVPTKLGLTSCDVDFSAATVLWPAITDVQLNTLFAARFGAPVPAAPAAPFDFLERYRYWAERACRANGDGTPKINEDATVNQGLPATANGVRFGLSDEYQMRLNGGLANPKALTRLETLDPNLKTALRAGRTENDYTAVAGNCDAYFRDNPRRWLTAFSGESLDGVKGFDSNLAGGNPGFLDQGRFDLNAPVDDAVYANLLQNWMGAPLYCGNNGSSDGGGATDDYPYPQFFLDFITPPGNGTAANTANAAKWWAGNVAGNRMAATARTPGTKPWNNLLPADNGAAAPGPLPVLTEAYYQCFKAYKSKTTVGANHDVTVESLGANCGYCLEFSNPYSMPVQLRGITWSMTDDDTYTAATTPDLEAEALAAGWPHTDENGVAVLMPGHKLLLWRNGDSGTATAPAAGSDMDNNLKMVGTQVAAAVANAPTDPNNAALGKTVHAVPSSLAFGPKSTYSALTSNFVKFQVNAPQRDGATVYKAYQYLTLPTIHDVEVESVPKNWAMPAVGTGVGIAQCSARTWGLKEGLDVLQCRPARAPHATLNAKTAAGKIGWTTTSRSDRGDTAICYNRAFDGTDGTIAGAKTYDPSFFTSVANTPTLGLDDKTTGRDDRSGARKAYAYGALGGATRPRIGGDIWWFAGNDWYWGSDGKAHYRHSRRMASAADLHRIPHLMLWPDGAATDKVRPGTTAGIGPGTKTGGGHYTDTDLAHWLFFALNQEIDPAGTVNSSFTGTTNSAGNPRADVAALMAARRQPLDALRLHPWTDTGTFKNYAFPAPAAPATAPTSRKVPFPWMEELLYCVGKPGQTGGLNWQDISANPQLNLGQKWLSLGGNGYPSFADATNRLEWPTENDAAQTTAYGKLNLNTTPVWLLEEALPIKDQAMRKAIADLIVKTRDNTPANAGTRAADDRGLAYMAELIPVVANAAKAHAIPNWPTVAGKPDVRLDTVLDILGPLWQTTGTRSDFFAAHILVQGFQANNFSTGAIESAKVLIILKRDQTGTAVVGSYNY